MFKKSLLWAISGFALMGTSLSAAEAAVNFTTCLTDSKYGKKEQENFEAVRKQITRMVEDTEQELRELAGKFEDTEYLDSLSPKAEEELKTRYQALNEDLSRYQGQFYQIMQQANMQLIQKMSAQITKAAEKVAQQKKVDYIINKEACFYVRPDLDLTSLIIAEMDKNFELDMKTRSLSDNTDSQDSSKSISSEERSAG